MAARSLPLLYSFRRCPYAMRARMALLGAGVPFAVQEVDLRHKPAAMLELSPKGTVPVLHLPDGSVIDQSLDILHWALRQADPAGWLAVAPASANAEWVQRNDVEFKPLLDCYKYAERHPDRTAAEHRQRALEALILPMEAALARHHGLVGAADAWADLAVLPFVRQFAQVDRSWFDAQPLPGVQAWLARWTASDLFLQTMRKPLPAQAPMHVFA